MRIEEERSVADLFRNSVDARRCNGTSHRERLELRNVGGAKESRHHERASATVKCRHIRVGNVTEKKDVVAKPILLNQLLHFCKSIPLLESDKHEPDIGM